jgi:signal transduction histidine kinase
MTIRTRLTLWYVGIVAVCATLLIVVASQKLLLKQHRRHDFQGEEEKDGIEWDDVVVITLSCAVPAALAGGWWLMRKTLSPISALTQATARINEHHLREQLPRTGSGDEVDRLTEVFNAMTARLDDAFKRIREFTLHASHELKTPLTVMRGGLETALRDENLSESLRESLLGQLDETQRLAKIVDGLALLTKADAGLVTLQREPVQFDELVRDSFDDAQILAQPREVRVALTSCEKAVVVGDRHRLRQMLLNLTDNAVKYNQHGGSVTLALRRDDEFAELTISNTGTGIPAEVLARIFDPFFRGDAAHARDVDGCGLGLAIARWIVNAHGGTIDIASKPDDLTTATVRLPLAGNHCENKPNRIK